MSELPHNRAIGDSFESPSVPEAGWTRSRPARIAGYVVVVLAFGTTFAYGVNRIQYGFGINDEGSYLVQPMRLALGDVPFRDEIFAAQRMFDIILAPVFMLYPEVTVYQYRVGWLFVQFACVLMLFRVFSRFAPAPLVALGCAATFYLPNLAWTPAYHHLGTFFFILSWSLLFEGFYARRITGSFAMGAFSGIAFWIGAMSYMPLLALAAVPTVTLAVYLLRSKRDDPVVLATGAHLAALSILTAATVLVIGIYGLWGDWWQATQDVLLNGPYQLPFIQKLSRFYETLLPFASLAGAIAVLVFAIAAVSAGTHRLARFANTRIGAVVVVTVWSALVFAALYGLGNPRTNSYFEILYNSSIKIVAAMIGVHIGVILSQLLKRGTALGGEWGLVYAMTLTASLLFAFLQGFLSGMPWKMVFAAIPLFVTGVTFLYRSVMDKPPGGPATLRAFAVTIAICVAVGIQSYAARARQHSLGEHGAGMTYESSIPQLAGLYLPANGFFQDLDSLVAHMRERIDRGEFLLVDGFAPGIYYLTGTRPAWDHAWISRNYPVALTENSIRKMVDADRVPEYVVRFVWRRLDILAHDGPIPANEDPAAAFISKHYSHTKRFGPFEVWKLEPNESSSSGNRLHVEQSSE